MCIRDSAHTKDADHLASQGGGVLQIIFRAGGNLIEDDLFGGSSAQHAADTIQQLRAGHEELIIDRQLESVSERRASPGNDTNLVNRVGAGTVCRHQSVAGLMVSYPALLILF